MRRALRKSLNTLLAGGLLVGVAALATARLIDQDERAPVVDYTLLDGSAHRSDALQGQVVLVNFWSTSCTACMHEMPRLVALHERLQALGLQTLAVAMRHDAPEHVVNYVQSRQLPFEVTFDRAGRIAQAFGHVQLTPTAVLIDRSGRIVERIVGEPDFVRLEARITALLAEPAI